MTGASQATVLGSAKAPEPSGLGPTGAIPSAMFSLHPKLRRALDKYEKARGLWHAAIREAQAVCKHEVWACQDGHSGMLFNHPSIQICTSCRAEVQTGTYNGWSTYAWRHPKFVRLTITPEQAGAINGEICAMRLLDDPREFQSAEEITSAIEARRAETGAVHESAVPERQTPDV